MQHFLKTFLLFVLIHNTSYGQEIALTEIDSFGNNSGNLKMFIHYNSIADSSNLPLVVVLHGCGETAKSAAELTGWNKLADLNNFVVLYPQQNLLNNPSLCFNWFNDHDIKKGLGECESITQMIYFVKEHYSIDSARIFITGLSAGAAMSVVMTATHPELFKCGAIFAGGAYKLAENSIDGIKTMRGKKKISTQKLVNNVREENPNYTGQYPPLIIYQGINDPVVDYENSKLLINQWTALFNADTIPDKIEYSFMGVEDITRFEYTDSSGQVIIIFYEVNRLGHRLMINPGENENEGGQTGIFGVDKDFHSTYQTALEFGLIKKG